MFVDGSSTARTQKNVPYIHLDADHDFRDLVARLLSVLGRQKTSPIPGNRASGRNVTPATPGSATKAGPSPCGSAPLVIHRDGRLYVNHHGVVYRLRFWIQEEWATLPHSRNIVVSSYDHALGVWAGLEPAPHLTN